MKLIFTLSSLLFTLSCGNLPENYETEPPTIPTVLYPGSVENVKQSCSESFILDFIEECTTEFIDDCENEDVIKLKIYVIELNIKNLKKEKEKLLDLLPEKEEK